MTDKVKTSDLLYQANALQERTDRELLQSEARCKLLEDALVYSAFAQHDTPQYMLPKGITLIDNDRVVVTLKDGRKVAARSGGSEHGDA